MKLATYFSSRTLTALLCGTITLAASGQPTSAAQPVPPSTTAKVLPAAQAPPLTEDMLRAKYVGKLVFLRGFYMGDDLHFNEDGSVDSSPAKTSFTLSALEIRKVHLTKRKLEFEADRYGLHFFGALPYEDDSKPFDKVKISHKTVHISIDRELVVIPKEKKNKEKNDKDKQADHDKQPAARAAGAAAIETASVKSTPAPAAAAAAADQARTTVSTAHSNMLLDKALDNVFAVDFDPRMLASLPNYWQEYFKSKRLHREYMPADVHVLAVSDGVTPPHVLNSIDPSSNEYAQKFGIAGLTLFRTVVDATGTPQDIAIDRPIGFGLDEKAVDAIRKSHFTPAMRNGHPVPVVIDIVVTFRIYSNRTKPGSVPKGAKRTVLAATSSADQPGS